MLRFQVRRSFDQMGTRHAGERPRGSASEATMPWRCPGGSVGTQGHYAMERPRGSVRPRPLFYGGDQGVCGSEATERPRGSVRPKPLGHGEAQGVSASGFR